MAAAKAGKISGLNPADIKNCCTSFGEEFSKTKTYLPLPSFTLDYSSVINNYGGSFNAPNYPNLQAFAALKADGSIAAWGYSNSGGTGAPTGTGFTKIYSTDGAFAALKDDGSIVYWKIDFLKAFCL